MQADGEKRRPVCFLRHFYQWFSRFQTLDLSPDRYHSWLSSDDLPTVLADPRPKLSPVSKSLGNQGYTKVVIRAWDFERNFEKARAKTRCTHVKHQPSTAKIVDSVIMLRTGLETKDAINENVSQY